MASAWKNIGKLKFGSTYKLHKYTKENMKKVNIQRENIIPNKRCLWFIE